MLKICVICVLCSESLNRLKALMGHNVHHVSGLCAKSVCSSSEADLGKGVQKMLIHIFIIIIQSQRRKKLDKLVCLI